MSSLNQQRPQTQMWPDWITSGNRNDSQNTSNVEELMAQHARRKIQLRLKMARSFQKYRAKLCSNKHGVSVSSDPPSRDEKICLTLYQQMTAVWFTVKNSGVKEVGLTIWASNLVKNIFTVRDGRGNKVKSMTQLRLRAGEAHKLMVTFCSKHGGFYEQLLVFLFETPHHRFEIMRLFEVVRRTSFSKEPLPAATSSPRDFENGSWIPARGFQMVNLRTLLVLKYYGLPKDINDLKGEEILQEKLPLTLEKYRKKFQLLLHLEEFHQQMETEKFNQEGALFRHKSLPNIATLKLAGSTPGLPAKLEGNAVEAIYLKQPEFMLKSFYKGWVQHADAGYLYLQFDEEFFRWFKDGMRFRFNFILNRVPLRLQHRAAELACKHKLEEVLFPTGQFSSEHPQLHRMTELANNPEQRLAVQHIVAATAKPAPYLVFGPPGTGKTVTLVEAINQIMKTQPNSRILACAPSNNATDHLCEKLLDGNMGRNVVYRLYALSFPVKNIPQKIKDCCNLKPDKKKLYIPNKRCLMTCRILLTSLQTSGRLVTGGIPPGHYTYIFVDEAGQARETECIIPIAGLVSQLKCQVVLAGDPKQLGPTIRSRMAQKYGLDISLLERLMTKVELYQPHETHGLNKRFVTKLLRNYRSHPAILKIPNELFYGGELQPFADREACSFFCEWECLPKKGFPLIFHGVAGTDEREGNCPSVYNMAEVEVLKEYLKALLCHFNQSGVREIGTRDIGIIAPYRKQVEKIQKALQTDTDLRKHNLTNILVGSVEQFQGKEFNAILVSAVRSIPKLTAIKQLFTLGFVENEKRFNVAVTRARALLIVVGDPRILQTHHIWNKFIYYCLRAGGYRGIEVSGPEEEEDEATPANANGLWWGD